VNRFEIAYITALFLLYLQLNENEQGKKRLIGIGCSKTANTSEDHDKALYGENLGNSRETQRDVGTKE
jgi:hypothetical protein